MKILLVAEEPLEPHFSCKKNKTKSSGENDILQSEVQQKLAIGEKDTKVMKLFADNKCSICLSSYKETFDNDLHIVVGIHCVVNVLIIFL